MDVKKLQEQMESYQSQLPPQRKLLIGDTKIPFALGYKFDGIRKKWCLYDNDERSYQSIRYERDTEEEIINIFYQLIEIEIKKYKRFL